MMSKQPQNPKKQKTHLWQLFFKFRMRLANSLFRLGVSAALLNGLLGPMIITRAKATTPEEAIEFIVSDDELDRYSFVLDSGFGEGESESQTLEYGFDDLAMAVPVNNGNEIPLQGYGTVVTGNFSVADGGVVVHMSVHSDLEVGNNPFIEIQQFNEFTNQWELIPGFQTKLVGNQNTFIVPFSTDNTEYRIVITDGQNGSIIHTTEIFTGGFANSTGGLLADI